MAIHQYIPKKIYHCNKNGIKSQFLHFTMYSFKCYSKTVCLEQVLNRTEVWRRDLRSKRNSYYLPEPIAFFRIKPFTEIGTCQSWARHVMDICGRKHIWNQKKGMGKIVTNKANYNLPVLGLKPTFLRNGVSFVWISSYLKDVQEAVEC